MQKISQNIVLKSIDNDKILCLQSSSDYDYRVIVEIKNDAKVRCCIDTAKFLIIESEGIVNIKQEPTLVILTTKEGEYKLPVMRERGIFMVEPPVELPDEEPTYSWEYDFSSKTIISKDSSSVSKAGSSIVLGENLVAKVINKALERYGDGSTAKISISSQPYSLIQKLGKTRVNVYKEVASFVGEEGQEVRVKDHRPPIGILDIEGGLTSGNKLATFDISKLKLKNMSKFTLETVFLSFRTGAFSFITDSARKTIDLPDLVLAEPITLEILAGDLKYLSGEITLIELSRNSRTFYALSSIDKDKTTYLTLRPSYKTLTW